jgi:uncharacterized membrane protein YbhN (UPF0104 family)
VNRRAILNLGKYLLGFGLLAWVVQQNWMPGSDRGLAYVWQKHVVEGQPIQYWFLLVAFLAYCAATFLTIARWYVLVRAQGLPFRFLDALRLGLIGTFFNNILPSSVGGDVIKAAFLAREQSRRTAAVTTVLMDRLIGLWGLFWLVALLGGAFWLTGNLDRDGSGPSRTIVRTAVAIVSASTLLWLLLGLVPRHWGERFAGRLGRLPRLGGPAAEFWRAVWVYRRRPGSVALSLIISWAGFAGFVLAYYFSVRCLWEDGGRATIPTLAQHFLLVPIGLVIMAAPLFPGGAGIGELGFGKLYGWFRCSEASGVLGSLVQRALSWVVGLLGLVAYGRLQADLPPTEAAETSRLGVSPVNGHLDKGRPARKAAAQALAGEGIARSSAGWE